MTRSVTPEGVIRAGTSGFAYREWKGNFYPKDIASDAMLAHYAAHLSAVEINNTFYKRPDPKHVEAWSARVPASFRFVFKASRYFSAGPGLKNAQKPLADFFELLAPAKTNLGAVLVQLPAHVKKDLPMLADFVAAIPRRKRVALEFVDPSWRADDVDELLRAADVATCVTDSDDASARMITTASWGYFRLRKKSYDARALAAWAARLVEASLTDAFVFFKHEDAGTGPNMASALLKRVLANRDGEAR